MPRAEIVQRPLHAKLAQLLDVVLQLRIVRQRLALGDFQDQLRAFAADGAEQTPHVVDEPMARQVRATDIDTEMIARPQAQLRQVGGDQAEDVPGQIADHAVVFGQGMKMSGRT